VLAPHRHQSVATLFSSSIPKISETFFCSPTIPSARSARRLSRIVPFQFPHKQAQKLLKNDGTIVTPIVYSVWVAHPGDAPDEQDIQQWLETIECQEFFIFESSKSY